MEREDREHKPDNVPYLVFSDTVAHYHWVIRKLVYALIVAMVLIVVGNLAWLWVWQQYDYSSTETNVESDGDGYNVANYNVAGGNGGIINGSPNHSTEDDPDAAR